VRKKAVELRSTGQPRTAVATYSHLTFSFIFLSFLLQMLYEEQIGQIAGVAEDVVLFVGGD
jgi:hypothetical protein